MYPNVLCSINMDLKATYNKIAEDWHRDHTPDDWWVGGIEKFISFLPAGASVLDAGCGSGIKSKYFARRGFQVTGIDFSENLIAIAKRGVPEAEFRVLDIRDTKVLNCKFDGIFLQAVLLHFPKGEVAEVISSLLVELKPQGLIHVSVKETKPGHAEEEICAEDDYGYSYERFFSYFTEKEVIVLLENAGLEVVFSEIHLSGKTRWIQVIARRN